MRKALIAIGAGIGLAAMVGIGGIQIGSGNQTPARSVTITDSVPESEEFGTRTLPKCVTEDSDNCYWDGGKNGKGKRFVTIDGVTYYFG